MDPAQEVIQHTLRLQKPMNDVIERGDSPVQQFYNGTTVFVTGGSGFMGKHLIEKLLRSCAIKKIYLLLRSKKGKTLQERLQLMLCDPVYDVLRVKQPMFAERIVAIEGDVADIKLGLNEADWTKLTLEVDIIFHAAATVRFDEALRVATLINVRGTRDMISLARACTKLKSFVYVSTAYTSAIKDRIVKDVYEEFNKCPVPPEVLIALAEELHEDTLNGITNNFINGWPNTYTFTKTVAEELIRTAEDLPMCVVRPPIVCPAYYEPSPGWLDMNNVMGPSGIVLMVLLGVLSVFRLDKYAKIPVAPVEYVNNAIIAASWDVKERKDTGDTDIPIYTVANKDHYIVWNNFFTVLKNNIRLSTDKAVYMCGIINCNSRLLYWLLSWLLHYIPAYILDVACILTRKRPTGIKSFVDIAKKMDKVVNVYHYFLSYTWNLHNNNVKLMLKRMSEADRAIYNCDLSTIDLFEYKIIMGIGVRKYIIKDGLNNTQLGYKKQKIFRVINYFVIIAYSYLLYCIVKSIFILSFSVFNLCF